MALEAVSKWQEHVLVWGSWVLRLPGLVAKILGTQEAIWLIEKSKPAFPELSSPVSLFLSLLQSLSLSLSLPLSQSCLLAHGHERC
jgi:hypothetical protein